MRNRAHVLVLIVIGMLGVSWTRAAQMQTPADDKEAARMQAVAKAVTAAGYSTAVVVGHGAGVMDPFFALLATHAGKGVLTVVVEPGRSPSKPIDLETDQTPANLGVRGVEFSRFLDQQDLYDIEVQHHPFMLETSMEFSTHHVVRRVGGVLTLACDFDGGRQSSSSKGIGSMSSKHTVTAEKAPGTAAAGTLLFDLKSVDETRNTQSNDPKAPAETTRNESRKHYELPATGACKEVGGGGR